MYEQLIFQSAVGSNKMANQLGDANVCPFCNRDLLRDVLAQDGPILLVKNKYATLQNTLQTVLIETEDCSADICSYDAAYMRRLVSFGIDHWLEMADSGTFKSVLFYKNHGPLSGGTIQHAHMQIVGLENIDYRALMDASMFEGHEIHREGGNLVNASCKPRACFLEINVITPVRDDIFLADMIRKAVRYIMIEQPHCSSYNLFFYQWQGGIVCKIVPRYVASPLFIGYSISQISDQLESLSVKLRSIFASADN